MTTQTTTKKTTQATAKKNTQKTTKKTTAKKTIKPQNEGVKILSEKEKKDILATFTKRLNAKDVDGVFFGISMGEDACTSAHGSTHDLLHLSEHMIAKMISGVPALLRPIMRRHVQVALVQLSK